MILDIATLRLFGDQARNLIPSHTTCNVLQVLAPPDIQAEDPEYAGAMWPAALAKAELFMTFPHQQWGV